MHPSRLQQALFSWPALFALALSPNMKERSLFWSETRAFMPPAALLKCALKKAPPERNAGERASCVSSLSLYVGSQQHAAQERNAKHTQYTSHRLQKFRASKGFFVAHRKRKREVLAACCSGDAPLSLGRTISTFDAGWGANWGRMSVLYA